MTTNRMKSSPTLVATFEAVIAQRPALQRRLMFGCPCAFMNGNLMSGVVKNQLMMRLAEKDRAKAAAEGATSFKMRGGKPTREYMVLPADTVSDKRRLGGWLRRAIAHVETLPAKKPKEPKRG